MEWAGRLGPRAVDAGVVLLVMAATTIPFVVPRAPQLPAATWPAYLVTLLAAVPLLWRRRSPVGALAGVFAVSAGYGTAFEGPGQPLPYAALIAFYTVAALCPPRVRLPAALATAAAVVASVAVLRDGDPRELLFTLFVLGAAFVFGRFADTRRAYVAAVEDRAAQLERANRIEAEQAAARERARIAREMHDVLSHAVSLMVVQAEAGPVAVRTAPERAEAAFDAISGTGRDAMDQLRRMLGVLRDGPDGGPAGAPRAPQPGAGDLPELVARVRESGLRVSYEADGAAVGLSAGVGATVYRVVQEALTNTVRHAGARSAAVRLTGEGPLLTVVVSDDGRGPGGPAAGGGGHGLIGIRERAAAHGGTARTGPGPGGRGFEVRVRLPLRPAGEGGPG
ncbi:sensor histidine kinase [Streptomyces qinzhouensis]|uniref:histidine kinase n=1 Tax=Streptomyces qinzhouensis TaxID=2599401 RepID=A0A5B8INW3_9ACTN|nr:histidine kinase [Streptomyces qinzhouensis]QDY79269.1 sensor histidine kinase [Streptomyces qinzhouensis]